MKIRKNQIGLSKGHPSLLLDLNTERQNFYPPLLITEDHRLIDGYRRLQIHPDEEIDVIQTPASDIFQTALDCNRNTRSWNETDCFLWSRWARELNVSTDRIPIHDVDPKLFDVDLKIIQKLARGVLKFRQFVAIAQQPVTYHAFFTDLLTTDVELNPNETYRLIEMSLDLKKIQNKRTLQELFDLAELKAIIQNENASRKQRGENLLKAMRILRYPYYQKRSEEFSTYWQQLNIGKDISLKKSLFLERGLLELTITASSPEQFRERLQKLCETCTSPLWNKIWEE